MQVKTKRVFASLLVLAFLVARTPTVFAAGADPTKVGAQGVTGADPSKIGPQGSVGADPTKVGAQGVTGADPATVGAPVVQAAATSTPAADSNSDSTTQSNSNTGADSTNTNQANTSNSTSISQNNQATANTSVNAAVNTGGNASNQNTSVGDVQTGSINGSVNIVNVQNSHFAAGSSVGAQSLDAGNADQISLAPISNRADLSNSNTGAGSTNTNQVNGTNLVQINDDRSATANNLVQVQATTGSNTVNENSKAGNLQTGDVNLAANIFNVQNVDMPDTQLGIDVWSLNTTNPNLVIVVPDSQSNANTGAGSSNSNSGSTNSSTDISVSRLADSNTGIQVNGQTGGNEESQNTQAGSITTGDVEVGGSVVNIENPSAPMLYVVNVFGDWNGSVAGIPSDRVIINHNTGADSTNGNVANSTDTTKYTGDWQATNNNAIQINAITGNNTADRNTTFGNLTTGNVNVLANVFNLMNVFGASPEVLKYFHIGVINIYVTKPVVASDGTTVATAPVQSLPQNQVLITNSPTPVVGAKVATSPSGVSVQPTLAHQVPVSGYSVFTSATQPVSGQVSSSFPSLPAGSVSQSLSGQSSSQTLASEQPSSEFAALAADHGGAKVATKAPFSPQVLLVILGAGVWVIVELVGYALQRRRGR
jgi:hypothetical protein